MFERATATSLIILPSDGGGLKLNGPAAAIWKGLRNGSNEEDLAHSIAAAFGEDVAMVRPFVIDTLAVLRDAGAVDER